MSVRRLAVRGAAALAICWGAARAHAAPVLADAAEDRDFEKVSALVAQQADPNAAQADGMTALHWAAHYEHAAGVRLLLGAGADANARSRYGLTPLALACTMGNVEIVQGLLDAGADPQRMTPGGATPLMIASRTGRPGPVKALLAHGADVDARERKGQSALMWAAAEGHLEVVEALLAAGADFRTPLPSGFTSFFFAVREGRQQTALRLLQAGVDVNERLRPEREDDDDVKAVTPLLMAIENGHFELAVALLEAGADPNAQPTGFTPLHALTWVRKPIRGDGDPPPYGSGSVDSLEMVRQLVKRHANLDARLEKGESGRGEFTTTGSTPFMLAARASDVPLMQLLLELGADPTLPNVDNCPPLLAAAGVGVLKDGDEAAGTEDEALEAVRLLLDHGADIDAVDANGETAMHGAVYQDRPAVIRLLDERGADSNVWNRKNKWGWTPLMIAQGHRAANFRPAPASIAALEKVTSAHGGAP